MTGLSALAVALSACTDLNPDIGSDTTGSSPLTLSVMASDGIVTRGIITGTSLDEGAEIGLTLCDISEKTYQGMKYVNISYKASGSSSGQTWSSDSPLMVSNTPGTVYGYYPYSEEVTSLEEISIEATSSVQTDWMYATSVSGLTKDNAKAEIILNHALSAVRLSLKRGSYSGTGQVTAASVSGEAIPTAASLDARTGKLSSFSGQGTIISPKTEAFTLSGTATEIDIIAIPSDNAADMNVKLTIDGKEFTAVIPDVTLEQGKITCCEISVNDGEVYITDVAVQAWTQTSAGSQIVQNNFKVTFEGDTEGLSFSNSIDEDGNVTIIAVPYISDAAETKPVTITGSATLSQSVDENTGILTINLSDIQSDVSVVFDGFYLWLTFTHEITDISSATKLYYSTSYNPILRMKIDGEEIPVSQTYQFSSTGTHTVKMAMTKYKEIPGSFYHYIKTATSAVLPEGVETIGAWAFIGASKFREVSLPSTLKTISYQVFERTALESCTIPDGCYMSYGIFDDCYSLTYARLPSDITEIPDGTFSGCSSLTDFEMPSGVTTIGHSAFEATALESIHFPDAVSVLDDEVCKSCKQLKEVKLPANLTSIKRQAFYYCTNLERVILSDGTVCTEEVIIPEGVTFIDELGIMTNSPYIKRMRLPSTLTDLVPASLANPILEEYTMTESNPLYDIRNCSVIETATNTLVGGTTGGGTIHETVTAIGEEAFYCSKVETVDLHEGVTQLHDLAFYTAYPKVIISRSLTPPTLGNCSFQIAQYNGTLKVPEDALQAYKDQWMINEIGYLGWSTARWSIQALADGE